jgi:hypothetical protein
MLGDLLQTRGYNQNSDLPNIPLVGSKYYKKLFSMGDNIGISFCNRGNKYENLGIEMGQLINKFCREKSFNSPDEAAEALLNYIKHGGDFDRVRAKGLQDHYDLDGEPEYVIHVAGYSKNKYEQKEIQIRDKPVQVVVEHKSGMYRICTCKDLLQEGESVISSKISDIGLGFWQCGNMRQIKEYVDKISNNKDFLEHCTLQDAVNATMYVYNAARGFEWMIDRIETISEDFEMLSITKDGLRWLKKHELELKENLEVKI